MFRDYEALKKPGNYEAAYNRLAIDLLNGFGQEGLENFEQLVSPIAEEKARLALEKKDHSARERQLRRQEQAIQQQAAASRVDQRRREEELDRREQDMKAKHEQQVKELKALRAANALAQSTSPTGILGLAQSTTGRTQPGTVKPQNDPTMAIENMSSEISKAMVDMSSNVARNMAEMSGNVSRDMSGMSRNIVLMSDATNELTSAVQGAVGGSTMPKKTTIPKVVVTDDPFASKPSANRFGHGTAAQKKNTSGLLHPMSRSETDVTASGGTIRRKLKRSWQGAENSPPEAWVNKIVRKAKSAGIFHSPGILTPSRGAAGRGPTPEAQILRLDTL